MYESVTFFGTSCEFARHVVDGLIACGYRVNAQVFPGSPDISDAIREIPMGPAVGAPGQLPMSRRENTSIATARIFEVNHHDSELCVRTLSGLGSDISVVCCYPRRLPMDLINTSKHGGLNVHPSLLPAYRGPDPLFWAYRKGETETGVTIHRVDEGLDTGRIVRQRRLDLSVGTPGDQAWTRLAQLGTELLVESIRAVAAGESCGAEQDLPNATYFSWPAPGDLIIRPSEWNAWHVYHFCRGVIPLGHMPRIVDGAYVRRIIAATGYVDVRGSSGSLVNGAERIPCRTGEVYLQLGPAIF